VGIVQASCFALEVGGDPARVGCGLAEGLGDAVHDLVLGCSCEVVVESG
jgi:hypothetical protein